jgi:hypothetical protein
MSFCSRGRSLVRSTASSARVSFALTANGQELELTVGPLCAGASQSLRARVAELADELTAEPIDGSELVRIVVRDGDRISRASYS